MEQSDTRPQWGMTSLVSSTTQQGKIAHRWLQSTWASRMWRSDTRTPGELQDSQAQQPPLDPRSVNPGGDDSSWPQHRIEDFEGQDSRYRLAQNQLIEGSDPKSASQILSRGSNPDQVPSRNA